jgi:hypothetical protein
VPILSLSVHGDPVAPLGAREQLLAKAPSVPVTRIRSHRRGGARALEAPLLLGARAREIVREFGAWNPLHARRFSIHPQNEKARIAAKRFIVLSRARPNVAHAS